MPGHITAFCGFGKGSGKTTAFSWFQQLAHPAGPVALLTIGSHQSLGAYRTENYKTGTSVPHLQVQAGDIALTTLPLAKKSAASFEIVGLIPGRTKQGRLVLGRAHRSGLISLTGPEHFSSLRHAAILIWREKLAQSIFLDGAASRLTQLSALPRIQFVYTIILSPENTQAGIAQLTQLDELIRLPQANPNTSSSAAQPRSVTVQGPLTESIAAGLPESAEVIIIDDFSKVFLGPEQWRRFVQRFRVQVRHSIPLLAVWLVLRDLSANAVAEQLNTLQMPLLFNPLDSSTKLAQA